MGSRKYLLGPTVLALLTIFVCWVLVTGPVLAADCADTLYEKENDEVSLDSLLEISVYDGREQMQVFEASENHTVTSIKLALFTDNAAGGSDVSVELWTVVDTGVEDFVPDVLLSSGTYNFNLIGEHFANWGWYCVNMGPEVTLTVGSYYGILVWFDGEVEPGVSHEVVNWVHDEDQLNDWIFDSYDNGTTWGNEAGTADCMFEVWGNPAAPPVPPAVPADAMFEVWGEADPPYGVFIAAVPALFKLATLLGTILAAILVLRSQKPTGTGGGYG